MPARSRRDEPHGTRRKRALDDTDRENRPRTPDHYLAEFDFRMNNRAKLRIGDMERTAIALKSIEGKRLTYRGPYQA